MSSKRNVKAVAALSLAVCSTFACATAQRTFVASHGLDTNACSLTQPCRTFGTAIGQTLAGGEVIVLDSAGYGSVTITKSVVISGPAGIYAGVAVTSGTGITVDGTDITVSLRGLTINGQGSGTGIDFANGNELNIEDCVVAGLTQGIHAHVSGASVNVKNTTLRNNGNGFLSENGARASLNAVHASNNFVAVFALDQSQVSVSNSDLSNNTYAADIGGGTPNATRAIVTHSIVYGGSVGLAVAAQPGTTTVLVSDANTITHTNFGLYFFGSGGSETIYSRQNNTLMFNGTDVESGTLTPLGSL